MEAIEIILLIYGIIGGIALISCWINCILMREEFESYFISIGCAVMWPVLIVIAIGFTITNKISTRELKKEGREI